MRLFVVFQPGCDMFAADVFAVSDDLEMSASSRKYVLDHGVTEEFLNYVLDHGVTEEFLNEAEPGDVCFFDRDRVIMRVRRAYDIHHGWVK